MRGTRAPAGRELLDSEPRSADSRAYRATRVAPDVIRSTVQGARTMSSGGNAAAVSLTGTVRVTNPRSAGVAQAQGFARRTAINQSGRVNELTGGTVRPADAVTGAEIGPYRKSRL